MFPSIKSISEKTFVVGIARHTKMDKFERRHLGIPAIFLLFKQKYLLNVAFQAFLRLLCPHTMLATNSKLLISLAEFIQR